MRATRDLVFKTKGDHELRLDVHRPDNDLARVPAVLWISGGGWAQMSRRGGLDLAGWITEHGYAFVPIDYRPAPAGRHPECIKDVKAAIRFLRQQADQFGIDPEAIGVWGDSAGGHLALLAASTPDHPAWRCEVAPEQSDAVQAAIGYAAPCDFRRHVLPMIQHVSALLGVSPLADAALARDASPISYVAPGQPPQLLVHGDSDLLVPIAQSRLYHSALRQAGIATGIEVVPGCDHDSQTLYASPLVNRRVLAFLKRHLPTDTPGSPSAVNSDDVSMATAPT